MYKIQQENGKFAIYKKDKALHLPCKLLKKKKIEFQTEKEAQKYISDVMQLIKKGESYIESF